MGRCARGRSAPAIEPVAARAHWVSAAQIVHGFHRKRSAWRIPGDAGRPAALAHSVTARCSPRRRRRHPSAGTTPAPPPGRAAGDRAQLGSQFAAAQEVTRDPQRAPCQAAHARSARCAVDPPDRSRPQMARAARWHSRVTAMTGDCRVGDRTRVRACNGSTAIRRPHDGVEPRAHAQLLEQMRQIDAGRRNGSRPSQGG